MKKIYPKPIAANKFEFIFLKEHPGRLISNSNDPPDSFHSRDIFTPHKTIPGAWKYLGRLDDRVTLMNGEKVLPLPIEGSIRQHKLVREAVVFGIGRAIPGLLIFRSQAAKELGYRDFVESVWPSVDDANQVAESFSQIGKEMIVPMPAEVSIPLTDKGSIIRAQVYNAFEEEIEEAYIRMEQSHEGTTRMDGAELETHLLRMGQQILGPQLSDPEDDLFTLGMNSLQAIQMRGSIVRELYLGGNGRKLSQNVIFEHGNIANLAKHLEDVRTYQGFIKAKPIAMMKDLVSRFSVFEKHRLGARETPKTRTIVSHRLSRGHPPSESQYTPGPHRRNRWPRCTHPQPPSQSTECLKDLLPDPWCRSFSTTSAIFPRETIPSSQLSQASNPRLRSQRSPPRPQPCRLHDSHIINNPHYPLRLARKLSTRPFLLHPFFARLAKFDSTVTFQHPLHACKAHLLQLHLCRTRHTRSRAYS